MERLVELLLRFKSGLLFLILQIISIVMMVQLNQHHNIILGNITQDISGEYQSKRDGFYAYFDLSSENQQLLYQNKRLKESYLSLRQELETRKNISPLKSAYRVIPDSLFPVHSFQFIPCQIVNNTVDRSYNFITINKGYRNGIKKGMGLISEDGVLGMVISVSEHYALAMSVLNKNFKLSAKINHENFFGSLVWKGGSPSYASLEYIPLHVNIRKGDTIITTGFSSIFPEGFMVGIIDDYEENSEDGFYEISVQLNTSIGGVYHAYAIANIHKNEIDSLENSIQVYQ
jgi:rod shape-determining protein MreC